MLESFPNDYFHDLLDFLSSAHTKISKFSHDDFRKSGPSNQ